MSFSAIGINESIIRGLTEEGIVEPTNIQQQAIPLVLEGKSVIALSRTGSGKTAAFGVPLLQMVNPKGGLQMLILAPTRELVVQIAAELKKFGKYTHCTIGTVYGGVAHGPQIEAIQRSEIIVGTTGRLNDHLESGNLDLSNIRMVVLDEADKMVDMGFIDEVRLILDQTPQDTQILLFGATLGDEVAKVKEQYMQDPVTVKAETLVKEELLEQYFYNVQQREKFSLLVHLLKKEDIKQAIIFCSTRTTVDIVARNLQKNGIPVRHIHGKLNQSKRLKIIEEFNSGKSQFLVASAVAARGLHIDDVSHVFNYDLAQDPQEYIHRVGRTARAGASGKAITLLSDRDHEAFREILRRYDVQVNELPLEPFERVSFHVQSFRSHDDRRGYSGGRGGGHRGDRRFGRSSDRGSSDRRDDSQGRDSRGPRRSQGPYVPRFGKR
jgi:superfamily II DNA/RNA helicase